MDERASTGSEAEIVWQATIGAALARRGRALQASAVAIAAAAILFATLLRMIEPERAGAAMVVLSVAQLALVGIGLYFGQRVALDADLFAALARCPDPVGFDAAMVELGLVRPSATGRSMRDRVDGLKYLLFWQIGAIVLQLALFVLTLAGGFA